MVHATHASKSQRTLVHGKEVCAFFRALGFGLMRESDTGAVHEIVCADAYRLQAFKHQSHLGKPTVQCPNSDTVIFATWLIAEPGRIVLTDAREGRQVALEAPLLRALTTAVKIGDLQSAMKAGAQSLQQYKAKAASRRSTRAFQTLPADIFDGRGHAVALYALPRQDLKRIEGIDARGENALYGLGYRRYEDIARWQDRELCLASQVLGLEDYVIRYCIIEQAEALAKGICTPFADRYDRALRHV